MASSVPLAVLGRDAKISERVKELILPEYDGKQKESKESRRRNHLTRLPVVHTCIDMADAETEFPLICAGQLEAAPKSGLGSNAGRPVGERRTPTVVYFGGGVSDQDVEKLSALVREKAPDIRFLRVTREEVIAAGAAAGPDAGVIAKIMREKMASL